MTAVIFRVSMKTESSQTRRSGRVPSDGQGVLEPLMKHLIFANVAC